MKELLRTLAGLTITGLLLTSCSYKKTYHHRSHHINGGVEVNVNTSKKSRHHKKSPKVNKKDMNKSGLSDSDIKKDSRAVQQKKSTQPVD